MDWTCSKIGSQERTVKNISESNPEGSKKGRHRLRWLEDVEKDLWEMSLTDGDRRQPTGKNGGL